MTRICAYSKCEVEFEPKRPHHRFHRESCRYADFLERQENGGEDGAQRVGDGVGSRGGNVRDLDTAGDLQAQQKEKRDWRDAIDEQIRRTLLETGFFHADDLDALGVPPEHAQLKGTRSAWFRNQGFMEKTGAERKVSHKAANGRKAAIHRITKLGREKLAGVGAGSHSKPTGFLGEGGGARSRPPASTDPGEQSRPSTGAPGEKSPDRSHKPEPVPSASDETGESPAVSPDAAGDSARAPGEAAGVGAGTSQAGSTSHLACRASVDPGGTSDEARLFELPPERPGHDRIGEAA